MWLPVGTLRFVIADIKTCIRHCTGSLLSFFDTEAHYTPFSSTSRRRIGWYLALYTCPASPHGWELARQQMKWPPVYTGPGLTPAVVSAVPPPLMFFRCATAEKQRSFFFIWMVMRRDWLLSSTARIEPAAHFTSDIKTGNRS